MTRRAFQASDFGDNGKADSVSRPTLNFSNGLKLKQSLIYPEYFELVTAIRQHDKQSLEKLFRLTYGGLRSYANTILNSKEDAEDIVQDIFFKLWTNRAELDESKSIKNYLYVCTRNSCLNFLKHARTKSDYARIMSYVHDVHHEDITPFESLVAADIESDLGHVLKNLPPQCRKVFELSRFEGLKYHEIATKLNISIKTVETQMSRALNRIRLQLKKHSTTIHSLLGLFALFSRKF